MYRCIKDYCNPPNLVLFKSGEDYLFNKVEYSQYKYKEIEYRFCGGFAFSFQEKPFKKHFINLRKRRENNLVKLLDL